LLLGSPAARDSHGLFSRFGPWYVRRAVNEGASVAIGVKDMLEMSEAELDELFRNSPAGEIPDGDAKGTVLVAKPAVSGITARFARWVAWQGKVFNRARGDLKNKILPFGIRAVRAKVYKEASWFDGKETIVLDYSKTSRLAKTIRDEIREVAPHVYLGLVFQQRDKVLHFALEFAE
jgi:hypothetical protein